MTYIAKDFSSILNSQNLIFDFKQCEQASMSGCSTTLEQQKLFQPQFGPQFFFLCGVDVLTLLDVRHCSKLQTYAISRKTNDATLRKWQKP